MHSYNIDVPSFFLVNMHSCRNIGCNEKFKWRMQLSRHVTKCSKPVLEKSDSIIESTEGYQCARCGRKYKFKENVYRHFKICKQNINNVNKCYRCLKCYRSFLTKDLLESHVKQCMPINEQGVFVDTSNDDNVVLVIPLDDNFLPLDNHSHFPSDYTNAITEPQGYVCQSKNLPTSYRPIEVMSTLSPPVAVKSTLSLPLQVKHNLSLPRDVKPSLSHPIHVIPTIPHPIEIIPTTSCPVDRHNFTVDVKTVRRSTCSNCQRHFVRHDHFQRHIKKCASIKNSRLSCGILQNFTCSKCDRKYQRKDHYERHVKKCVYLKAFKLPEKTKQKQEIIISESFDILNSKGETNTTRQLSDQSIHRNNSSVTQVKYEPDIIDLTDTMKMKQPNAIDQPNNISRYNPDSTKCVPYVSYSNNRDTSKYLWEKSLHGASNKVTIINNIRKVNTDRSLTLQSVTDKIVSNLTNERSRNLQKWAVKNHSCNDNLYLTQKNADNINNDRSLNLLNMTEKLIENYSDELSNMDCSDLMSIGKKKDATKDNREQWKDINQVGNLDLAVKDPDKCTVTTESIDSSTDDHHRDKVIVENIDFEAKEKNINMDIIENVEAEDIRSLLAPNEADCLSLEKEAEFQKKVCNSVVDFLKRLYVNNHSRFQFHKMMREIFQEQLNDQQFVCWLYKKLL